MVSAADHTSPERFLDAVAALPDQRRYRPPYVRAADLLLRLMG